MDKLKSTLFGAGLLAVLAGVPACSSYRALTSNSDVAGTEILD